MHSWRTGLARCRGSMERDTTPKRRRTERKLADVEAELYEPDVELNPLRTNLAIELLECARELCPAIATDLMNGMSIEEWAARYHLTKSGMPPYWARQTARWSVRQWKEDSHKPFLLGFTTIHPPSR